MLFLKRLRYKWILRVMLLWVAAASSVDVFHILSSKSLSVQSINSGNQTQRIFIASTHWNSEALLRDHWNAAVLELISHLGPDKTFLSILESGSWDNTKQVLRTLEDQLANIGANFNITLDDTTHEQEISKQPSEVGWVNTPRGRRELRRIPYLAKIRNESLQPLQLLASKGILFDKVLFLNDIVFSVEDVLALLGTHNDDYAAACALDFSKSPSYYDTFALRDANGHKTVMSTWPYFRSRQSLSAVRSGEPVPVSSCWGGMVAMRADSFYAGVDGSGLRFRAIPDSLAEYHLEASECCLIHQDNPLSQSRGVFLNSQVRVGYNKLAYDLMNGEAGQTSMFRSLLGLWQNRVMYWLTTEWFDWRRTNNRLAKWHAQDHSRSEPGALCLVNEMQVLAGNGWAHV